MIGFMIPTKPDWSGLVLLTQNLSYNSEFVHLPSWYRPLLNKYVVAYIDDILIYSKSEDEHIDHVRTVLY